jgi:hypothetical protein
MDRLLNKMLNQAVTDSIAESSVAIKQAVQYMRKKDITIEQINFEDVYDKPIIFIKILNKLADDIEDVRERSAYVQKHIARVYKSGKGEVKYKENVVYKDITIEHKCSGEYKNLAYLAGKHEDTDYSHSKEIFGTYNCIECMLEYLRGYTENLNNKAQPNNIQREDVLIRNEPRNINKYGTEIFVYVAIVAIIGVVTSIISALSNLGTFSQIAFGALIGFIAIMASS